MTNVLLASDQSHPEGRIEGEFQQAPCVVGQPTGCYGLPGIPFMLNSERVTVLPIGSRATVASGGNTWSSLIVQRNIHFMIDPFFPGSPNPGTSCAGCTGATRAEVGR